MSLSRTIIINYLKEHKQDFMQKYSIDKLALFGSFATDNNTDESDVDIAYQTSSKGLTLSQLSQLEDELYGIFGKNIDLVNIKYMNPLIKRKAIKDMIYV